MRRGMAGFILAVASVSVAWAELTPERIAEAIAAGKKEDVYLPTLIQKRVDERPWMLCGVVTTPFLRVALAAEQARKKYEDFTPANVTASMLAPEIEVDATSRISVQKVGEDIESEVRNVAMVVVAPIGSSDIASVVRPKKAVPAKESFRNAMGGVFEGQRVMAYFAPEAMKEGWEFRIVYEEGDECRVPINPTLLR